MLYESWKRTWHWRILSLILISIVAGTLLAFTDNSCIRSTIHVVSLIITTVAIIAHDSHSSCNFKCNATCIAPEKRN